MASYSEAIAAICRESKVRRNYYVCGAPALLREDVVDAIRGAAQIAAEDTVVLSAALTAEARIWEEVNAYALGLNARRLVIVRDAERLRRWEQWAEWISATRSGAATTLVLVSGLSDWPGIAEEDGRMVYADEITRARMMAASSSMFVRVTAPSERSAPAIVARWARCGETDAAALLTRVGGDLTAARDAARKMAPLRHALAEFKGARVPDRALLETLSEPHPREDFVTALTARRKDRALSALEFLDADQTSRVIGMLAANVEALGRINRVLKREERVAGISDRLRMHRTRVEALLPHAGTYDPARVRSCTALLAAADAALADGAGDGLLEMVVAGW